METGPSTPKKSAAIVSKPEKPELASVVPELVNWLRTHQYEVVVDRETAAYATGATVMHRSEAPRR